MSLQYGNSDEHQLEAARLLDRAQEESSQGIYGVAAVTAAIAQGHATLALAIATQDATHAAHGVSR